MINLIQPAYAVNLGGQYAFGNITSTGQAFTYLVKPGFAIAGTALVLYFIIGAFKFLTSGGEKEKVADARATIAHSIIGVILLMMMFLVLQFLPQFFGINIQLIGGTP